MAKNKNKQTGKIIFNEFYENIFGERWDSLKNALYEQTQPVKYFIPNSQKEYFLDSASILAALCLPLKNSQKILDLCAAPGGKTLVLASRMSENCELYSNERSPERKNRLTTVVKECLPIDISKRIKIYCSDGAIWCKKQTECFDSILLDAPCSSERHVINDKKYLDIWTPSRIKTVTTLQWSLLSCAFRLLKNEGFLLYSTCALCPKENDEMIEKLINKFKNTEFNAKIVKINPDFNEIKFFTNAKLPEYEKTKFGYQVLPDKQNGAGPIYFSLIQKK